MADRIYVNGVAFEPESGRLTGSDRTVTLRPRTAAVLSCLVARAGEVVSKRDLLQQVWPDSYVTESTLAVCVNEVRRAFDDDPRRPRLIATAHGRGYRLIGDVRSAPPPPADEATVFVGRSRELALLRGWLDRAERGRRSVGFVAAPAGVGKTALLDTFIEGMAGCQDTLLAWGQCPEHLVEGEPYGPLLDALAGLCRGPGGRGVRDVMARVAPNWLLLLPALLDDRDLEALGARAAGTSAERMMRELADALAVLATDRTVVLVIEDLHAGDRATVEFIGYLAGRREPARLLLLGSYRPAEAIAGDRPFRRVVQDLRSRRRCEHLSLELLSAADVGAYLALRLAPSVPAPGLVADIHERTDGHALFLVATTDFLTDRQLLGESPEGVTTSEPLAQLGMPHEVRQMLERSIDLLDQTDRRMLEVAAAVGPEFSVEALRAGLVEHPGISATEVEDRCARIAREHPVLVATGEWEWPDGTLSARYRFAHGMYRDLQYERLGPHRRALVHRAIGRRMAAGWGERSGEVALEMATHFERGRDADAAVRCLSLGAETALARSAYPEVLGHVEHGLELLEHASGDAHTGDVEIRLRRCEVVARGAVWSWHDERARAGCLRLRELAAGTGDTGAWTAALLGLHNHARTTGDLASVGTSMREIDELAHRTGDGGALLIQHFLHMQADSRAGRCAAALERAQVMLRIYRPVEHRHLALLIGEQLDVAPHLYAAVSLWQLGYPDQARRNLAAALGAARHDQIPVGLTRALWWAAVVHTMCGDAEQLEATLDELEPLCRRHAVRLWAAGAAVLRGYLRAWRGDLRTGLKDIRRGMAAWDRIILAPNAFHLRLLAEQCLAAGDRQGGLTAVSMAFQAQAGIGPGQDEPEVLRLRGELMTLDGLGDTEEAERDMRRAMELAREREARGFELRAASSLVRLLMRTGRPQEGRALLAGVLGWFTEGEDTADIRSARTLLQRLSAGPAAEN